jgi:hypothetical protein
LSGRAIVKQTLPASYTTKESYAVVSLLWAIVVILVVLWLLGLVLNVAGGLIHVLLIIAIIVVLYNLFVGRRST